MEIRIRQTEQTMFWNEFRELLLAQNPSELITVAPQTEDWLDAHGADVVFEGPQATGGTVYQYSQRSGVEQVDGKWYTRYILGPVFVDTTDLDGVVTTAAEHEAAYTAAKDQEQATSIRQQRNELLSKSDWTQVLDAPVDRNAWASYRQNLRDISAQPGFPWNTVWPEAPAA